MAHPTDGKLLEKARAKVLYSAEACDLELKQAYTNEGRELHSKAGRYSHARKFLCIRKVIKRQRTIVGRLQR